LGENGKENQEQEGGDVNVGSNGFGVLVEDLGDVGEVLPTFEGVAEHIEKDPEEEGNEAENFEKVDGGSGGVLVVELVEGGRETGEDQKDDGGYEVDGDGNVLYFL
jgi:hypothetical protein